MYHLSIKITSRGKGKSAVAAAAYRAGEKITNEYTGLTHDYTKKSGVAHTEILLPKNAPTEYKDRAILWNAVERTEKASNNQLAREIELALPIELTLLQNQNLVREYVQKHFVEHGMCADIAIHNADSHNPHAHILLTMRPFNEDGTWGTKQKKEYILDKQGQKIYDPKKRQYKCKSIPTTDWNEQTKAEEWRAAWADTANRHLEKLNHTKRIDHRSYKRQGKKQIPTIHLGVAAHQMEKRGIRTDRGNINRAIEISNRKLRQIEERLNELQGWLAEEKVTPQEPTFADVIADILSRQGQIVVNTATASKIVDYLKAKKINGYDELEKHMKNLMGQQRQITHKFNPIRKRITEIGGYMDKYEAYKKHKAKYDKYQQEYKEQKPWKKKAFERDNGWIVDRYNEAKSIIDGLKNSKNQIPINAWKKEYDTLSLELRELDRDYQHFKNEVDTVNKIRVNVYDILRKERPRGQPIKAQGLER